MNEKNNYPKLIVELKPFYNSENTEYIDINMIYKDCNYKLNQIIASMTSKITSVPTSYKVDSIKVFDDKGEIDLNLEVVSPPPGVPFGEFSNFKLSRNPIGDIIVNYKSYPRHVTKDTKAAPLFDLRKQGNGLLGAGVTFLALAEDSREFDITIKWNLESMPKGAIGVWAYGENTVQRRDVLDSLNYTYFSVGNIEKFKSSEKSNFTLYWLGEQKIDTISTGEKISKLYDKMSALFNDDKLPYKIFIRKTPYNNIGGTAGYRSFIFEYSDYKIPTPEDIQILIAHEMVHNWLNIYGEEHEISIYAEGTAEFYSIFLSYELGLISKEELIKEINIRLHRYYTNKFIELTGKEAMDIAWKEQSAQEIPYGRGFIYMMQIDKAIKDKSNGEEDLSIVCTSLLDLRRKGVKIDKNDLWKEISKHSDFEAKLYFENLMNAKLILPPKDYFEDYKLIKIKERRFELGMSDESLRSSPRAVTGLVEGSNAQIVGIKNGDIIKEISSIREAKYSDDIYIDIVIIRDDEEIKLSYLPRGKEVESYKYVLKS